MYTKYTNLSRRFFLEVAPYHRSKRSLKHHWASPSASLDKKYEVIEMSLILELNEVNF